MKIFRSVITLLLLVLVLVFAVQNMVVVEVQFLVWSVSMPRSLLVLILLLVGFLLGWIVSGFRAAMR